MIRNMKVYRVAVLLRSDNSTIKKALGSECLGCILDYFDDISSLMDLKRIFLNIRDQYDGILTSGLFSDRYIACNNTKSKIAHRYFSASVENYYRQILLHMMKDPDLQLQDIRLDLMTREHSLPFFIQNDLLQQMMDKEHDEVYRLNEAEILLYEQEMVSRQIQAAMTGEYKLFMTRSAYASEKFAKQKVPYQYVALTDKEIYTTLKMLRRDMEMKELRGSQVACIYIVPEHSSSIDLNQVRDGLTEFLAQQEVSMIQEVSGEHVKVITDSGAIDRITYGHTSCVLTHWLTSRLNISLYVGYGIGSTADEAEENAVRAVHYTRAAAKSEKQVYLIDSDDQIVSLNVDITENEPKQSKVISKPNLVLEQQVNRVAQCAHLSSKTVLSLMLALQKNHRKDASSDWLIRELSVSSRMANRILNNLEKSGFARVEGRQQLNKKGRPINIYTFDFTFAG